MVQCLRIRLAIQGTEVQSLVREHQLFNYLPDQNSKLLKRMQQNPDSLQCITHIYHTIKPACAKTKESEIYNLEGKKNKLQKRT